MAFKYACFVSYCHGQYDLLKGFMDQLKAALKAELEPLLDESVYIDEERLKPGYRYNEALATAICESICMIVVYSPTYERHEYCLREFEGMERLETQRRRLLGLEENDPRGFIIPIVLRGFDQLPDRIKKRTQCVDFSRFSLAMPDILRNPLYVEKIQEIAKVIHEQYQQFTNVSSDPCLACAGFQLPARPEVTAWRPQFVNR